MLLAKFCVVFQQRFRLKLPNSRGSRIGAASRDYLPPPKRLPLERISLVTFGRIARRSKTYSIGENPCWVLQTLRF